LDFFDRFEAVRARHDVLQHSFYQRWSAGDLSLDELAIYAGEYRHAVLALAGAASGASAAARASAPELAPMLADHAAEEADHVGLWDDFARAVGARLDGEPRAETSACARAWVGPADRPLLESLVVLYAIESGQPAIADVKRQGLRDFYGITDPAATAYFDVHVERDVEHAAAGRELIAARLSEVDEGAREAQESHLLTQAEAALRANWLLLDGVERG
jgi:pyrroloquinoline-quinone synthase